MPIDTMSAMATNTNPAAARPHYDLADISIALLSGAMLAITALFLCVVPFAGKMAGSRDFVAYYATGRQLVQHADPYDTNAVRQIEHASGLSANGVLLMRNPPWSLPLAYPLGFFGVRIAAALWSLMQLGCLLVSVYLIRQMNGSPPNHLHWLGISFTPALICLTMGQTSILALLGLTLFLRFHNTRPFGAGAALWLCAMKPHLLLPLAVVLALWIVVSRSYKIAAGAVMAMAASFLLTWLVDPSAFAHYTALMRSPAVVQEFVPCLSDSMRFLIDRHSVWIQYLPAALASLWALVYFWCRRHVWNWAQNGNLLILVSLIAAPYAFPYDQSLAIPAVLHGAYTTRKRSLLVVLTVILALFALQSIWVKITSPYYLWSAPVWLAWYLLARAPQNLRENAAMATAAAD
ncbi:MAG TPA: glycosyltransferase 87 family protein [Terracidiphilus sp.]|nr:glycosyltransferase 87 family protein [Terracidiphilus sp.]